MQKGTDCLSNKKGISRLSPKYKTARLQEDEITSRQQYVNESTREWPQNTRARPQEHDNKNGQSENCCCVELTNNFGGINKNSHMDTPALEVNQPSFS